MQGHGRPVHSLFLLIYATVTYWLPVANEVADRGLSMQKALCSDIVTRVPGVLELRWPGEESGSVEVVAGSQSLSAVSAMALCR